MKKLILFLLPLLALAQNPTNFPYGIKNPAATSDSAPAYFVTSQTDNIYKKTPAALIALKSDLPVSYAIIVYVNDISPSTATIFDDENPPTTNDNAFKADVDNLYIGTDASTWVYNGTAYVTKIIPSSSNFNLIGASVDAGSNKSDPIIRSGTILTNGELWSYTGLRVSRNGSNTATMGGNALFSNAANSEANMFQLNASNGVDLWNYASGVWNKRFTFSSGGNFTAATYNGYTPENSANKSDSYTASSSITYASTKALVDGLGTKVDKTNTEGERLAPVFTSVFGWGDSLTVGSGFVSYPTALQNLTGFTVTNKGVGGETSTQIKDRFIADTGNYDKSVILWVGRNNFANPTTVKADIATMIAALSHTRYLVVSIINRDTASEYLNGVDWVKITQLNADLKALYGDKYVDVREYLVSKHNQTAQDLIDYANDVPPSSLRYDSLHLNTAGYQLVANYLNQKLGVLFEQTAYLQSKDLKYYFESFSPLHTIGSEYFTGVKSSTNTGSSQINGILLTNNGTSGSHSMYVDNTSTGSGIQSNNSSSGRGIYSNNTSTGQGIISVNSSTGNGIQSNNTSTGYGIYSANSSTGKGILSDNTSTGSGIQSNNSSSGRGIYSNNTSTGQGLYVNNSSTGNGIQSDNTSTGYGIYSANSSTGKGILSDNTSTGSGIQSNNSSSGRGIYSNNTSTGQGIISVNSSTGNGIQSDNTSTGYGIYSANSSTGKGILSDNTSTGSGIQSNNSSSGRGIYSNNTSTGQGLYVNNSSTGYGFYLDNTSTGRGIYFNSATSSTGDLIQFTKNGVLTAKVDHNGIFNLPSPVLTGTPTAPTATAGTNTTQIATTAFVQNAMTSGTYVPTFTNTTNISSSTLNAAYYTKINNIITVTIAVQLTLTATADTVFTFSLPVSGATVVNGVGQGNLTSGGGSVSAYGIVDTTNSTTAQLRIGSAAVAGSGAGVANIIFTYSL